ncbi:MAG: SRPBCC family protein [Bauldia sp.]
MKTATSPAPAAASHPDVVITRTFHAPRALVWEAFTEPKHLREWWGPHWFTNGRVDVDLRVGGTMRIDMTAPDGAVYPMKALFKEISPPEKLVMLDSAFDDERGVPKLETLTTITFTEDAGRTTVKVLNQILHVHPDMLPALAGMEEGWSQSLERLGADLGSLVIALPDSEPVVRMSRIFAAPRELVWEMLTNAEHLKHWWGPRSMTTVHCEMDARPGGRWAIHQVVDAPESIGGTPAGTLLKFRGRILEVDPPARLVQTFGMEGEWGGEEIREVVTLTDIGNGRTLYTGVSYANSFEEREAALATGMSYGAQEMFDRLDEYLPTAKA